MFGTHILLLAALSCGSYLDQRGDDARPVGGPVLSDEFASDTRSDYEIQGPVEWKPGRLEFGEGGLFSRSLKAGSDLEFVADLELPPLERDRQRAATSLVLAIAGDGLVWITIERGRRDGNTSATLTVEWKTKDSRGKPEVRLRKFEPLGDASELGGAWSVRSRHGLVRVRREGRLLIQADTRQRVTPLSAVAIVQAVGTGRIRKLSIASTPRFPTIGDEAAAELKQLADRANQLVQARKLDEAAELYDRLVERCRALLSERHEATLNALLMRAMTENQRGNIASGRALAEGAMRLCREIYGDEHPRTAEAWLQVAMMARNRADYPAARAAGEAARSSLDLSGAGRSEIAAAALEGLAYTEEVLERFDQARRLREEALAIRREAQGPEHPATITALGEIASHDRMRQNYRDSAREWEEVVALRRRVGGDEHPETVDAMEELAYVLRYLREFDRARDLYTRTLEIRRRLDGDGSRKVAEVEYHLGGLARETGDYLSAAEHYRRTLAFRQKVLGPDAAETGSAHFALGELLGLSLYRYDEAAPHLGEALRIYKKRNGPGHPSLAAVIQSQAFLDGARRDFAAARRRMDEALGIARAAYGERHPDVGRLRSILGGILADIPELEAAEAEYKRALEIYRDAFGPAHPRTAEAMADMADIRGQRHDFRGALALLDQSLAIRDRPGAEPADVAKFLASRGRWRRAAGDYRGARADLERALAVRRKVLGPRHPDTGSILSNLGGVLSDLGEFVEAGRALDEALQIDRATCGEEHPYTADSYAMAGYSAYERADYPAARVALEKALAINRKVRAADAPAVAGVLHDLGRVLHVLNEPTAARADLEEALARRRALYGDDHPITASTENDLGMLLLEFGDWAVVRAHLDRAVKVRRKALGPKHPDTARSLRNLALALLASPDGAAEARARIDEALDIQEAALGPDHFSLGETLAVRAYLRGMRNELDAGRDDYQRALRIAQSAYGPRHLVVAHAWASLGRIEQARRDLPAARRAFETARDIYRDRLGEGAPGAVEMLGELAWLAVLEGDYPRALRDLEAFLPGRLALTRDVLAGLSEAEALAFIETCPDSRTFLTTYRNLPADLVPPAARVYEAVAASRAQATRLLAELRERARSNPVTRPLRERLAVVRGRLAELALSPEATGRDASLRAEAATLAADKERLEREIARLGQPPREAAPPATRIVATLSTRLPADMAVVEFVAARVREPGTNSDGWAKSSWHLEAFVLRRNESPDRPRLAWLHLGPLDPAKRAADDFRRALADPASGAALERVGTAGRTLRRSLWDPLEPHLAGCSVVTIIPDAALTRLPWAALPGRAAGTYLIEDYALATAEHAEQVAHILGRDPAAAQAQGPGTERDPGAVLLVGGVAYDREPAARAVAAVRVPSRRGPVQSATGRPAWPFLAGTRAEIDAVAGLATGSRPVDRLEGEAASEAALRALMPGSRYVHLATHGFFADEAFQSAFRLDHLREGVAVGGVQLRTGRASLAARNPLLLSAVVLAGANLPPGASRGDGLLTAEEVAELDLERTELIVLSACETGLGEVTGGEGVLGLQRAFELAGARAVIASLWQVDDDATRALMAEFYRRLWSADRPAKAEALRRAQMAMIRGYDLKSGTVARGVGGLRPAPASRGSALHPFYWAAFTLGGDWR